MPKPHVAEQVARDLHEWLDTTARALAQDILGSPLSPPTASLTQADKLRFFANKFWTPDGRPNAQGRAGLLAQYGATGFEAIATALAKQHDRLHTEAFGAPLPEPDQSAAPVMPVPPMAAA